MLSLLARIAAIACLLIASSASALQSTSYSDQALADAQAAGKPVVLHFHADWCGSCKVQAMVFDTLRKEGKPEAAIPKILEGKIHKLFYQSLCLLDQLSVRDSKTPVASIIKETGAKLGGGVSVTRFSRYQLGE